MKSIEKNEAHRSDTENRSYSTIDCKYTWQISFRCTYTSNLLAKAIEYLVVLQKTSGTCQNIGKVLSKISM